MKNKNLILLIIVAVLFFCAGAFMGSRYSNKSDIQIMSYEKGWNDAKKRVEQNKNFEDKINPEIYSILGEVIKREGKRISVHINPINPLDSPEFDQRVVIVGDGTVLYRNTKKDKTRYDQELKKFYEENPRYKDRPDAIGIPNIYFYSRIDIEDIPVGAKVRIRSEDNIRYQKEFEAKEILVL